MVSLAAEIERANRREQIAALDHGEQTIAAPVIAALGDCRPPLGPAERSEVMPFVNWCKTASARHAPAKPNTVAAYILVLEQRNTAPDRILLELDAIETLHDHLGLPNPTRTAIVKAALDRIETDPPRSWPAKDKTEFARLPAWTRRIIAQREHSREREIRRLQNKTAEELKKTVAGAETKPEEKQKEELHA